MDKCFARRVREPRLKPLASCLALALALSTGTVAAAPTRPLVDRPAITQRLANWKPSQPMHRIERNAAIAMQYPALQPVPRRIPQVPAGSVPVTNCDDSGPGSLRDAVATAVSGQTIDLTATGCSTITLTTGHIFMTQEDLTLQGPGSSLLTIDGGYHYSLRHSNAAGGTLGVYDLSIAHGRKYFDSSYTLNARGGCLYSSYGTISLGYSVLEDCSAETANPAYAALGGAIYAKNAVIMSGSVVVFGAAGTASSTGAGGAIFTPGAALISYSGIGFNYASAIGGAIVAGDGFFMKYSTVLLNQAYRAGAMEVSGNITIENSTLARNNAPGTGGVGYLIGTGATSPITVVNSTISGNTAGRVGGIATVGYPTRIANSTIAFNTEANAADLMYGAGLYTSDATELESTIVANNTLTHSVFGPVADDIGGSGALSGNNNLTQFVLIGPAPADTIYADPRLGSLSYNGGSTRTHALSPLSPAVEAGNNVAGLATDQRGPGFARVIGANADIGAFELDLNDVIFADDFEN